MKVCLVTGEYPPLQGGVGDYTRCLAQSLVRRGCQVTIITSTAAQAAEDEEGITVLPVISHWGPVSWLTLRGHIQRIRPQVVNIQYQPGAFQMYGSVAFLPLFMRLAPGPASVVTFHDLQVPYLFPKAGGLRGQVRDLMAKTARAAITTNPEDAAALPCSSHLVPIGSNIPAVIPRGYDRAEQRRRLGIGPSETALAYFGFLNPSKGIECLLRALYRLRSVRYPATLLMVGGMASDSVAVDAEYAETLRADIEGSALADFVRWTGFCSPEEVTANLLAADVAVLPFRDGASFRNGTLAAVIAHCVPLITTYPPRVTPSTAAAALRSGLQLKDGVNARLVPPDDDTTLAKAIMELAADPLAQREIREGLRGLARVVDWDTIGRQTLELYRSLARR